MKKKPHDESLASQAAAARARATKSFEETVGAPIHEAEEDEESRTKSATAAPQLKEAYRKAVKLMHPDLAVTDQERKRRTQLMSALNAAYERQDLGMILKITEEFGHDPDAIVGEDVGSRMIKTIRRIAQLRKRLNELLMSTEEFKNMEIYRLRTSVEQSEASGKDPLGDLAKRLRDQITQKASALKNMRHQSPYP